MYSRVFPVTVLQGIASRKPQTREEEPVKSWVSVINWEGEMHDNIPSTQVQGGRYRKSLNCPLLI
jgi:hypothetical protein